MKKIFIILLILYGFSVNAQTDLKTGKLLSYDDFIGLVKANHPIAKQADILTVQGKAQLRTARGDFDPKASYTLSQKNFTDKQYYDLNKFGLKIPTWYGLEFNTGYEQNEGILLNPENSTPGAGLWQAGVSLDLGNGLFIDKRRASLKKAKLMLESSFEEKKIIYNELIYEAGKVYWEWFEAHNNVLIYENALTLAEQRFNGVKLAAFNGDKPFIDTVEAKIQVQNRQLNYQQSLLNYQNTTLMLSTFLWMDGVIPLELKNETAPLAVDNIKVEPSNLQLESQVDSIENTHPYLKVLDLKIQQLEINRKLKSEMLKPNLNLNYNAINQPIGNDPFAEYNMNNYKWGLEISMPLFLRKERGELKFDQLEIQDNQLEL